VVASSSSRVADFPAASLVVLVSRRLLLEYTNWSLGARKAVNQSQG
jgi:hypothetical protein